MCGAYFLEDGKDLLHYYIDEGSVIHPLYERYGATLQLRATTRSDAVHEKLARGKKRNERE